MPVDHEDYLPGEAPATHKETHQDGGTDEISIADLAGVSTELAAHALLPTVHQDAPALIALHKAVAAAHHVKTALVALPSDEHLEGYWPFDDGSGAVAVDGSGSGNGNDATLVNMEEADWVDGVVGKCLSFDGNDEYVNCGAVYSIGINDVSVSLWFKSNDLSQQYLFINKSDFADNFMKLILQDNGQLDLYTEQDAGINSHVVETIRGWNDGKWHHVVITREGAVGKIYVDGVSLNVAGATKAGNIGGATEWWIGQSGVDVSYFVGLIDEVRIYNTVLTASEIKALYLYPAGNKSSKLSGRQVWQTGVVAPDADETKFSHKVPVNIDGSDYYIMLTQT